MQGIGCALPICCCCYNKQQKSLKRYLSLSLRLCVIQKVIKIEIKIHWKTHRNEWLLCFTVYEFSALVK